MSIGPVNNTNAQAIHLNAGGQPETGAVHHRNEALGNVHASSMLATAGRIALGILTLGISEGIRALVKHYKSRPSAQPRINQPVVSAPKEPKTNFEFDKIESALGRAMTAEEKSNLRTIEQEFLTNKTLPKKERTDQVKNFQEKLLHGLNQLNRIDCSDKTKGLSKTVLMQHPKLVNEKGCSNLKTEFFTTAYLGIFPNFEKAMHQNNQNRIVDYCSRCGILMVTAGIGSDQSLKDAKMTMKSYDTIERYHLAEPFKALPQEIVDGIKTHIDAIENQTSANAAKIFFNALMQYRN